MDIFLKSQFKCYILTFKKQHKCWACSTFSGLITTLVISNQHHIPGCTGFRPPGVRLSLQPLWSCRSVHTEFMDLILTALSHLFAGLAACRAVVCSDIWSPEDMDSCRCPDKCKINVAENTWKKNGSMDLLYWKTACACFPNDCHRLLIITTKHWLKCKWRYRQYM